MDDKNALLSSIEQFPEEDMPRLMLADFLDENSQSDLDVATAEFIRISCRNVPYKSRQYSDEGKWLQANWQRLVPSLCEGGFKYNKRLGRFVTLNREHEKQPNRVRVKKTWVTLEFWKGLVKTAAVVRVKDIDEVFPLVLKDQKIPYCESYGTVSWHGYWVDSDRGRQLESACFISEYDVPHLFKLIENYDSDQPLPTAYNPAVRMPIKLFNGKECFTRARKEVSKAIRQYFS